MMTGNGVRCRRGRSGANLTPPDPSQVSRPLLNISIVVAGILISILHYELKPSPSDKEIQKYAQGMGNTTEWRGQIAPDFEIKTNHGENFKLSENVGKKIVVLNFFATWCGPCRAEMPELNRYFNEHKAESFLLIGVDEEESWGRVEDFLNELKIDFPVGIDPGPIAKQYGVSAFPTSVLIGVDGKVQFYETGALVNAEVAFDNSLAQNRQLIQRGAVISAEDYRLQAQKQPALPVHQLEVKTSTAENEYKLDPRGKRIADRMDCPCGCEKKVQTCTCSTSKNIKNALAREDFKDQPDDEIVKSLNKRFCSGAM
jgi:thiol-disulfide isomerase/thioredoxin